MIQLPYIDLCYIIESIKKIECIVELDFKKDSEELALEIYLLLIL